MSEHEDLKKGGFDLSSSHKFDNISTGQSWFLGIGINKYKEFRNLNNAVKDVKDIYSLLQKEYDVSENNSVLLLDSDATREKIIKKLDDLKRKIKSVDKFILYYSGHGHLDEDGMGYWIPNNAEKNNTANFIRNSTIRDYVKVIKARHTLLISDSCFSGSLLVSGERRSDFAMNELERRISRWAICSGRHDQEVADGQPGQNSPFCQSIIDVLKNNKEPKLNVAKLADRVIDLTKANYTQLPEGSPVFDVGHNGGQYIFKRKDACIINEDVSNPKSGLNSRTEKNESEQAFFFKYVMYPKSYLVGIVLIILCAVVVVNKLNPKPVNHILKPKEMDGLWGYTNEEGSVIIEPQFTSAKDFENDTAQVSLFKDTFYIDLKGDCIVNCPKLYRIRKEGKCFIKNKDSVLTYSMAFDNAGFYSGGFLAVLDTESKKWGFIDESGKVAIAPKYDTVDIFDGFVDGKAFVSIGVDTFFIDKRGTRVAEKEEKPPLVLSWEMKDNALLISVQNGVSPYNLSMSHYGKEVYSKKNIIPRKNNFEKWFFKRKGDNNIQKEDINITIDIGTYRLTPGDFLIKLKDASKNIFLDTVTINQLKIGDRFGGGIIAYILKPGNSRFDVNRQKGFIAAPYNQGVSGWGCHFDISKATATHIGAGITNTKNMEIVKHCYGDSNIKNAAQLCEDFSIGEYNDWYLPSKDELNQLFKNRKVIGNFTDVEYWSSTQENNTRAWYQHFDFGGQYSVSKASQANVRAIRNF